jgi:hypothetical protein
MVAKDMMVLMKEVTRRMPKILDNSFVVYSTTTMSDDEEKPIKIRN